MVGKALRLLQCPVRSQWPLKIQGKVASPLVVLITAAGLQGE
jgi:hypothetical protein